MTSIGLFKKLFGGGSRSNESGDPTRRRIREMLLDLPTIADSAYILDTGAGEENYSGTQFRASDGKEYPSNRIVAFLIQFLELKPYYQRNYAIGVVPEKKTIFASRKFGDERPCVLTFYGTPMQDATKLQADGNYDPGHGPLIELGRITAIRTGQDTFKSCFKCYSYIVDLDKAKEFKRGK